MKKYIGTIAFTILIIAIIVSNLWLMEQERENDKLMEQLQQQEQTIDGEYTLITNLSSVMYLKQIPAKFDNAQPWTDVNGVSGFDVSIGNTHLRYVEGHIQGSQLSLYAPYLYIEENIFD
jgi:hypothetical protein